MTREPSQNNRSEATRLLFMRAIEKLSAQKGLANVSTKEILDEAGQKNQSALQYHFGTKNELFKAVIQRRALQFEEIRKELIVDFKGEFTEKNALDLLIIPPVELTMRTVAGHYYIAFLAQAMTQPRFDILRAVNNYEIEGLGLAVNKLRQVLTDQNARVSPTLVEYKLSSIINTVILTTHRFCLSGEEELTKDELIIHLRSVCFAILKSN